MVAVRPLALGGYAVTVGSPPELGWFVCDSDPPRLGDIVSATGVLIETKKIRSGTATAKLTLLEDCDVVRRCGPYATRAVSEQWRKRVAATVTRPLYNYQVEGAAWLASRIAAGKGGLLGDDPGLGKTIQAIAAICATNSFPALVVCPAALKTQWQREWKHANRELRVNILRRRKGAVPPSEVIILNYELLRYREAQLKSLGFRAVVFDECQALKEPLPRRNHRAAVATRIAKSARSCLLLTGTPILNRGRELWRLLHLADPAAWREFKTFRKRYCAEQADGGRRVVTTAGRVENIDELVARAAPHFLRRQKTQVLADLPGKTRRSLVVELGGRQAAQYRAAEVDVARWLRSLGDDAAARRAARAQALVRLTKLRKLAAVGKAQHAVPAFLKQWFGRGGAREPLVVFAHHREVLSLVHNACERLGLAVTGAAGGETPAKRQRQIDAFQSGWGDVFIASVNVAALGLNLQRAADVLVIERCWQYAQMIQCEDRVWRLGQRKPVTIYYLDAAGTVDEHIATLLEAKRKLFDAAVDGISQDKGWVDELSDLLVSGAPRR